MRFGALAIAVVGVCLGCSPDHSGGRVESSIQPASNTRVFYEGRLRDGEHAVSIVLKPGWQLRESKAVLSVVQPNGNILNIGPATGPYESMYDVVKNAQYWVAAGRKQGGEVWDYRDFQAGAGRGAYSVRVQSKRGYVVSGGKTTYFLGGDIIGEVGGEYRLGFSGEFVPGDTDLNELTAILSTLRVEPKPPKN